jgi:CRISPR/Cas system endoribonuclease Cas6 (RAMP superfamily)
MPPAKDSPTASRSGQEFPVPPTTKRKDVFFVRLPSPAGRDLASE